MKKQLWAVLLLSLTCHLSQAETAADVRATEEMLDLMQMPAQLEQAVLALEERFVHSRLSHWRKVRDLSAEQEAQLSATETRASELFRTHLGWERMQPKLVQFFSNELSPAEIDQVIAFYASGQNQDLPEKIYVVIVRSSGVILEEASGIYPLLNEQMRKDLEAMGVRRPATQGAP